MEVLHYFLLVATWHLACAELCCLLCLWKYAVKQWEVVLLYNTEEFNIDTLEYF